MESREQADNDGADAEEERVLRLRAMLHDLAGRKGRAEAARELGLDPRTVDACLDGEGMSWRVSEALERAIRGDEGAVAAQQRQRMDALERRVDALELEFRSGLEAARREMDDEVQALREEQAGAPKRVAWGQAQPGTRQGAGGVSEVPQEIARPARNALGRRLYPELVTREPAPDDEEVYGDAWPLIGQWREIWKAGHRGTGKGLAWLRAEERVRGLEVALLEEHGLTLPPEKMPLYGLDRRDQLVWRQKTLCDVRKSLPWAELRGRLRWALTFGRWRN